MQSHILWEWFGPKSQTHQLICWCSLIFVARTKALNNKSKSNASMVKTCKTWSFEVFAQEKEANWKKQKIPLTTPQMWSRQFEISIYMLSIEEKLSRPRIYLVALFFSFLFIDQWVKYAYYVHSNLQFCSEKMWCLTTHFVNNILEIRYLQNIYRQASGNVFCFLQN